jgi:hypothetical protein
MQVSAIKWDSMGFRAMILRPRLAGKWYSETKRPSVAGGGDGAETGSQWRYYGLQEG